MNESMRKPLSERNGGTALTPTRNNNNIKVDSSPASVVTIPLSKASTPHAKLRSTIAMGDSGAEVMLDFSALDIHDTSSSNPLPVHPWSSPKKRDSFRPMNALIDSVATPSPNRHRFRSTRSSLGVPFDSTTASPSSIAEESTPSPHFLACCSAPDSWQFGTIATNGSTAAGEDPANQVQVKISFLLSSPVSVDTWCNGWQAWSYVRMGPEPVHATGDLKGTIQRVLRNRAFDMNARKQRLSTLRKDLNPFQATPPKPRRSTLSKSRSFNIQEHAPAIARYANHRSNRKLPSVWESVSGCATLPPIADSPEVIRSGGLSSSSFQVDDGYDSDPGDFLKRPMSDTMELNDTESVDPDDVLLPSRSRSLSSRGNDDAVIVHELMNERLTLILHPRKGQPRAISLWFEAGRKMCNELVSPKLVWKSAHKSKRKVANQLMDVSSVDLLDIHRILPVEELNRSRHPFAKTCNTFVIKTIHDGTLMLEASSTSERDRFVKSFKLLVARLGSMLVVQDDAVLSDFFVGVVPSPHFLTS